MTDQFTFKDYLISIHRLHEHMMCDVYKDNEAIGGWKYKIRGNHPTRETIIDSVMKFIGSREK